MSTRSASYTSSSDLARRRRILVCLDRSTPSEACVPHATSLARALGASITLAYIMESYSELPGMPTSDVLAWELARQEARLYLERLQRQVSESLGEPVDARVEQGRPATRIVDLVHEIGAEFTVLASRGEGRSAAANVGTTAQLIISLSRSSIFIVHASTAPPHNFAPKRILVPLDGSVRAESVLPSVSQLARGFGAEVVLVHIVRDPVATALLCDAKDFATARDLASLLEAAAHRYVEPLRQQLTRDAISARALVLRHTNERQAILSLAETARCDVIVVSAHGSTCDAGIPFGSVAAYLLTHAAVPLLVLQDLNERELDRGLQNDARQAPSALRGGYALEGA